jgi:GGDEF domain-containing protein
VRGPYRDGEFAETANVLQLVRDTLRPRSFDGTGCCKMPSEIDGVPAKVTASVGIASIEGDEADFAPAIARADAVLCRAKHAGRNRIEINRGCRPGVPRERIAAHVDTPVD